MDEIETVTVAESTGDTATPEVAASEGQDNSIRATLEREFSRDESGRFSAKQEEKLSDQPDAKVETIEPALPTINAPQSWTADKKELFKTFPRDMQEYLLQREKETTTKIGQTSERAAKYDKWEGVEREVGTVLSDKLRSMGLSPQDAVKHLVNAQAEMDRNPLAALQKIARSYGLIPNGTAQQQQQDPQLIALQNQVHAMQSRLQNFDNSQAETQLRELESQVNKWAGDKEHYGAVWESMAPYLQLFAGKMSNAEALDKAYAHAVHDSPEISQAIAQKADAQKLQAQKATADKARRAGSSLPSSSSNSTTQIPASDRRGMLAQLFDGKI